MCVPWKRIFSSAATAQIVENQTEALILRLAELPKKIKNKIKNQVPASEGISGSG